MRKSSNLIFSSDGKQVLDRGKNPYANHVCMYSTEGGCVAGPSATLLLTIRTFGTGVYKRFKYCQQCNLIMVERAKWAKNFDEVKYCSDKCRSAAKQGAKKEKQAAGEAAEDIT